MDGVTLISEAQAAGLVVLADGERLIVRGPKSAGAVALRLLANKVEVMAALGSALVVSAAASPDGESPQRLEQSPMPCAACGSAMGWRDATGVVTCAGCFPEPTGGERVVLVNLPGRNEWRNCADERREHERRRVGTGQPAGDAPRRRVAALTANDIERLNGELDEAAADELDEEPPE